MKIAFLNVYGGRVSRGAEMAVAQLAKRLGKKHEVVVFQSGQTYTKEPCVISLNGEITYQVVTLSGVPIISTEVSQNLFFRLLKKFYLDPYSLLVLYFSLRCLPNLIKGQFDIIIPINGFWQVLICKLVKFMRGGKIVVMGYAGVGVDDWVNLKLSPDAFFAMSEYSAKWAREVNLRVFVGVVPGGVDTKLFNPKVKPRKLPLKPPIVLTVAALVPYKRVDLTIRAVAKLKNISLAIAGSGPLRGEIEELGKNFLGDRFLRLDVNFDELPALYTACDIFTLASTHTKSSLFEKITGQKPSEAFGIVYVEAMACGLPVVAPDDPLRREIVGEGGVLIDCNNINEYARGLREALNKDWGDKPRSQAKKFKWDKVASEFNNALMRI